MNMTIIQVLSFAHVLSYIYFWLHLVFAAHRFLIEVVPLVAEPGSTAYKLSSCCLAAYGIFLDQGSNLCPMHCIGRQLLNPWTTKEGCVFFFLNLFLLVYFSGCVIQLVGF